MVPRNSTLVGFACNKWVGIIEIAKMVVVTETSMEYQKLNIIFNLIGRGRSLLRFAINIRVSFSGEGK